MVGTWEGEVLFLLRLPVRAVLPACTNFPNWIFDEEYQRLNRHHTISIHTHVHFLNPRHTMQAMLPLHNSVQLCSLKKRYALAHSMPRSQTERPMDGSVHLYILCQSQSLSPLKMSKFIFKLKHAMQVTFLFTVPLC